MTYFRVNADTCIRRAEYTEEEEIQRRSSACSQSTPCLDVPVLTALFENGTAHEARPHSKRGHVHVIQPLIAVQRVEPAE
jgi:hypothetical protein